MRPFGAIVRDDVRVATACLQQSNSVGTAANLKGAIYES